MPNNSDNQGQLIGRVVVTPAEPKVAESVLVEVRAPNGQSLTGDTAPLIRINGVTGARQYLQFARAGKQNLFIVAEQNGKVERRTVEVDVQPLAGLTMDTRAATITAAVRKRVWGAVADLPLLQASKLADEPYHVAFAVGGFRVFPDGLANAKPHYRKTLEPEVKQRLKIAYNLLGRPSEPETRPLTGPRPVPESALRPVASTTPIVRPGAAISGMPETAMLLVNTSANRQRLLPAYATLLRTSGVGVRGAITVNDAIDAAVLRPPSMQRSTVAVYHWDFGDSSTATTFGTRISHDYRASLDPNRERQQFDVTVRIEKPDGSVEEVKRTLSVYNAYAMCKNQGVMVPYVEQQIFANTSGFGFEVRLRIHNVEAFDITLTAQRIRVMSADTTQPDTITPLTQITPISIPAKDNREIPVYVPFSQVPKNAMGFTVYYFGNAPDGTPIRVEASFDVSARDRDSGAITIGDIAISKLPMLRNLLEGPHTMMGHGQAIEATATGPLAAAAELLSVRSIAGAEIAGRLTPSEVNSRVLGNSLNYLSRVSTRDEATLVPFSLTSAPAPVLGAACDPDNLPDLTQEQLDEGWVCQATPETHEVVTPARFLNALKGDVILSPGGNGLIGGLLQQVSPAQHYSHSGIMTRNYDQVTHSTASEARLLDHSNGSVFGEPAPTDGFEPNALKYMWPGVITQSVEHAVYGEDFVDPESAKMYNIKGFAPTGEGADIGGHWEIVPPLVVKPDPLIETAQIRAKLRQVANDALAQTGNSHYRFFCYTDPTLGQRSQGIAPPSAGWAAGTYPSVCSSFVWMTLKRQGVTLESANAVVSQADLEALDVAAGAQVNQATPDGLYLYTAEERYTAALWLQKELGNRVARKLEEDSGILAGAIDFFSDMIDDVSNQIINTFASDWADTAAKDSDDWKNMRDANAISPDNILFWDSPQALGLYGYAAPLSFRPARLEEVVVHKWRKVPTKGRLSGRVWFNGAPVAGALVQVYDGKTAFTDGSGSYEIPAIPFGHYTVKVWKDNVNGMTISQSVELNLTRPSEVVDITLQPPADAYRRIQVQAQIQTTDDEIWPWHNEHAGTEHFTELFMGPWHTHEEVYFEQRMGGEIRIELRFVIDLNMDRSVSTNINAKMYEGTSEDTNDLDDNENTIGFRINERDSRSGSMRLYNDEFAGGDISNIDFTITNLVQS